LASGLTMKSVPPDSASFDALWDTDEPAEEGLPPTLAPSLQGTVVPQEDRATLAPPVPPADYVQAMMELGELDDPMQVPPPGVPRAAAPPNLGLVMASERELLLEDPPRLEPRAPSPGPAGTRRRSTGRFPALQRAEAPAHFTPAPFTPPPRAMAMGA